MNWANYLIQINLYLTLFYAFYVLFLRNETFFTLNRTYLLSTSVFALMIPLYKTNWVQSFFIAETVQTSWTTVNMMVLQGFASPIAEETIWTFGDYLTLVYLLGIMLLSCRLIYKFLMVRKMFYSANHPEAFSFFTKIFVNQQLPQKEQIEKHEQTHAKQLHTADVLFFEILGIINWFNPIVYLYKKSIRHIHEFIADEQALHLLNNKKDYAMLLFNKSFGINPNSLTNNFFNQSLLKRRIQMLQKTKSRKTILLKYGLSAPLFLIAMILSSATISENKTIKQLENQIQPAQSVADIIIPKVVEDLVSKDDKKIQPEIKSSIFEEDFSSLKKHLLKTLKYPTEAKNKELTSKIAFEFYINKGGKIENAKALNQINNSLSEEGIRSLTSYTEKLDIDAGTYTIFITYKFADSDQKISDETTRLGVLKNFIGEVVVNGYTNYPTAIKEVKITGTTLSEEEKEDNAVFTNVEILPTFPGGLKAFGEFLGENLKYPAEARKNSIQGRVYLTFVVEKDGILSNIKVARGIGSGCDEEAMRVLAISPKWTPGMQNGKVVRVSYTVPIFFQMNSATGKMPPTPPAPKVNETLPPPPPPIEISSDSKALFIIDGVEYKGDKNNLKKDFNPNEIGSINVLKGEKAIQKYGDKGKDGVIEITTKKKK
jgi:TonB family protein